MVLPRFLNGSGLTMVCRAPVEDKGELIGMIALSSLILENDLF